MCLCIPYFQTHILKIHIFYVVLLSHGTVDIMKMPLSSKAGSFSHTCCYKRRKNTLFAREGLQLLLWPPSSSYSNFT